MGTSTIAMCSPLCNCRTCDRPIQRPILCDAKPQQRQSCHPSLPLSTPQLLRWAPIQPRAPCHRQQWHHPHQDKWTCPDLQLNTRAPHGIQFIEQKAQSSASMVSPPVQNLREWHVHGYRLREAAARRWLWGFPARHQRRLQQCSADGLLSVSADAGAGIGLHASVQQRAPSGVEAAAAARSPS
jgi:hypothetical protein